MERRAVCIEVLSPPSWERAARDRDNTVAIKDGGRGKFRRRLNAGAVMTEEPVGVLDDRGVPVRCGACRREQP